MSIGVAVIDHRAIGGSGIARLSVAGEAFFASATRHATFVDVADGVNVANQVLTTHASTDEAVADETQIALASRLVRVVLAVGVDVAPHVGAGASLRSAPDAVADETVVTDAARQSGFLSRDLLDDASGIGVAIEFLTRSLHRLAEQSSLAVVVAPGPFGASQRLAGLLRRFRSARDAISRESSDASAAAFAARIFHAFGVLSAANHVAASHFRSLLSAPEAVAGVSGATGAEGLLLEIVLAECVDIATKIRARLLLHSSSSVSSSSRFVSPAIPSSAIANKSRQTLARLHAGFSVIYASAFDRIAVQFLAAGIRRARNSAITSIPFLTLTGIRSFRIDAFGELMAIGDVIRALVHILTIRAISFVTLVTRASITISFGNTSG